MSEKRKKYLVLGLGASGQGATNLLLREEADVTAMDRLDNDELRKQCDVLKKQGAHLLFGDVEIPQESFDQCIISPGISLNSVWVKEIRARGIEIISELELGWSRAHCKVVAVSGTNGKSTAVKWITESLQAAGLRAVPAGNYGVPVTKIVAEKPTLDWLVLEVSSFQLETTKKFRPDVALLLNVLPNHLDRHRDMNIYEQLKAKLLSNMDENGVCVVHDECVEKIKNLSQSRGRWVTFGVSKIADYTYRQGEIWRGEKRVADIQETFFDNEVLGCNAAGVMATLGACKIEPAFAEKSARVFKSLPHRMEEVMRSDGLTYVDDSKATTLSAMGAALRMCRGKVRLIAGGLLKENDFNFIKEILEQKAAGVYLIGQSSQAMASALGDRIRCRLCGTLDVALIEARREADQGDTILLSPGCASFDQFRNYEDRGEKFKQLVKKLVQEKETWLTR